MRRTIKPSVHESLSESERIALAAARHHSFLERGLDPRSNFDEASVLVETQKNNGIIGEFHNKCLAIAISHGLEVRDGPAALSPKMVMDIMGFRNNAMFCLDIPKDSLVVEENVWDMTEHEIRENLFKTSPCYKMLEKFFGVVNNVQLHFHKLTIKNGERRTTPYAYMIFGPKGPGKLIIRILDIGGYHFERITTKKEFFLQEVPDHRLLSTYKDQKDTWDAIKRANEDRKLAEELQRHFQLEDS